MTKRKSAGRHAPDTESDDRATDLHEDSLPGDGSPEPTASEGTAEPSERIRKERDEYLDHLKRLKAEFDNYRKRTERERLEWSRQAIQSLVADLLPRIDDLERSIEASASTGEESSLQQGVRMILAQLLKQLEEKGLRPIETVGQPFDPAVHDAVLQVTNDEHPDRTVVEELRKGYTFDGKVLRPAQVKISRSGRAGAEPDGGAARSQDKEGANDETP